MRHWISIFSSTCFIFLTYPWKATSVPSIPHGVTQLQPDGSNTPLLFLQGDHRYNFVLDENGFTVVQDENGWYVYADHYNQNENDIRLVPTSHVVGEVDPEHLGLNKRRTKVSHGSLHLSNSSDMESSALYMNKKHATKGLRGEKKTSRRGKSQLPFLQLYNDIVRNIDTNKINNNNSVNDKNNDNENIKSSNKNNINNQNQQTGENQNKRILKNLVILMRFQDHETRDLPTEEQVNMLLNHNGPIQGILPTGSVADVYKANSYGKLILQSDVLPWITISRTERECADNQNGYSQELVHCIREALTLHAKSGQRFDTWDVDENGEFDGIMILHSGYGSEWGFFDCHSTHYKDRIWSHEWTIPDHLQWTSPHEGDDVTLVQYHISSALWGTCGNEISRIGAIAHETGHFLDLPDLYDVDQSGFGAGNYDIMGNMWGWTGDQYYPPLMSCWTKAQQNWIEPIELEEAGSYELAAAATSPACYKITHGFAANEYLLIENRYATSYDSKLPGGGGLAIWHIDEAASYDREGFPDQLNYPENGNHYKISLLQADGKYDLEKRLNQGDYGDLFREGGEIGSSEFFPNTQSYQYGRIKDTNIRIYDVSAPGPTMSFKLSFNDEDIKEITNIDNEKSAAVENGYKKRSSDEFSLAELMEQNVNNVEVDSEAATEENNSNTNKTENEVHEDPVNSESDSYESPVTNNNNKTANLNTKGKDTTKTAKTCEDDPNFFFLNEKQHCKWASNKKGIRCAKCHGNKCVKDFC